MIHNELSKLFKKKLFYFIAMLFINVSDQCNFSILTLIHCALFLNSKIIFSWIHFIDIIKITINENDFKSKEPLGYNWKYHWNHFG
jgi:hypothetical protein